MNKESSKNYFITTLLQEPGVPYYVSVVAVNQVGEGNSATAIVFTKADSKTFKIFRIIHKCHFMCR